MTHLAVALRDRLEVWRYRWQLIESKERFGRTAGFGSNFPIWRKNLCGLAQKNTVLFVLFFENPLWCNTRRHALLATQFRCLNPWRNTIAWSKQVLFSAVWSTSDSTHQFQVCDCLTVSALVLSDVFLSFNVTWSQTFGCDKCAF